MGLWAEAARIPCAHCDGEGSVPEPEDLRERCKSARIEARLVQGDVARALGVSKGAVQQLESGRIRWSEEKVTKLEALIAEKERG